MIDFIKRKRFIAFIIFTMISVYIFFNNEYMTEKPVECTVLEKMESHGKNSNFILIMKENSTGIIFHRYVNPAFWYQVKVNDVGTFNFRPFDIKQSFSENLIWFFLPVIIYSITFMLLLSLFIFNDFN